MYTLNNGEKLPVWFSYGRKSVCASVGEKPGDYLGDANWIRTKPYPLVKSLGACKNACATTRNCTAITFIDKSDGKLAGTTGECYLYQGKSLAFDNTGQPYSDLQPQSGQSDYPNSSCWALTAYNYPRPPYKPIDPFFYPHSVILTSNPSNSNATDAIGTKIVAFGERTISNGVWKTFHRWWDNNYIMIPARDNPNPNTNVQGSKWQIGNRGNVGWFQAALHPAGFFCFYNAAGQMIHRLGGDPSNPPNGNYILTIQPDNNMVLYRCDLLGNAFGGALWASG
jgi:hypothetical protein